MRLGRFLAIVVSLISAMVGIEVAAAPGRTRVVRGIQVVTRQGTTELNIDFFVPVRYRSHSPIREGELLEIRLVLVGSDAPETSHQVLAWHGPTHVPVQDLVFDDSPASGPALTLRFRNLQHFQVRQGSNPQRLTVVLENPPELMRRIAEVEDPDLEDLQVPQGPPKPPFLAKNDGAARDRGRASGAGATTALSTRPGPRRSTLAPETRVIQGLQVGTRSGATEIEIHFAEPFWYTTHNPAVEGDHVEIGIMPARRESQRATRQVFPWTGPSSIPLGELLYEEDAASAKGARLTVSFRERIRFEVRQGSNLETLTIRLLPAPAEAKKSTPEKQKARARTQTASARKPAARRTAPTTRPRVRPSTPLGTKKASEKELARYMEEGREAMKSEEYPLAIGLFTKILTYEESRYSQEAKELLGLARQRNQQLAHAKAEYEEYLERYPESEGAVRVRQRLNALLTATERPVEPLRRTASARREWTRDFSGSFYQAYRNERRKTEIDGTQTTESSLLSDVYLTARATNDRFSLRSSFSGSHRDDFTDDGEDDTRVTYLFVEGSDRRSGVSLRAGRQSGSSGGILGRFDGAVVSYQLHPVVKLNVVSGYPVAFEDSNRVNTDRPFYGVNVDLGPFGDDQYCDGQIFAIERLADGIQDRRGVGGELRCNGPGRSFLALVDYDLAYSALNTLLLVGNVQVGDATNVNVLLDQRKSPILTTSNALQGQTLTDLDDLVDLFGEDGVRSLAEDRTASSRTMTLGVTHQWMPNVLVGGDITISSLSDTDASGGVDATEGTGTEFFYSAHISRTSWLAAGDYSNFALRYSDGDNSDRFTVDLGGRYPILPRLRVGPEFQFETRSLAAGDEELHFKPSLRADYRWRRYSTIQADLGTEWIRSSGTNADRDEMRYFFSLAYRYDF
ncbi:MAG: tol-pal system YbgF family protein [Myxococcota bacterium]